MFIIFVVNIGLGEIIIVQIEYQDIVCLNDGQFEVCVLFVIMLCYILQDVGYLFVVMGLIWGFIVLDVQWIILLLMLLEGELEEGLCLFVMICVFLDVGFELGEIVSQYYVILVCYIVLGEVLIELVNGFIFVNCDFVFIWQFVDCIQVSVVLFIEEWNGQIYLLVQILFLAELGVDMFCWLCEIIFVIDNFGFMVGILM